MQTIQVEYKDGYYSCDIGISKDEWLEILKDNNTSDNFKDALLRFYYMPGHRGSCTAVSKKLGGNAYALNLYVSKFGQYVKKRLNRFEVYGTDGNTTRWVIPMGKGRGLSKDEEGAFEWELRPELVEALQEYLYWFLIQTYKELRKEIPLKTKDYDELYKWQLIDECKDHDLLKIAKLATKTNLVDTPRVNGFYQYLVNERSHDLLTILEMLVDESIPLETRLREYKTALEAIPAPKFKNRANDERTAATILTCYNPQKYTFYKAEGMYDNFCLFLGVERKSPGKRYAHYLELLAPLSLRAIQDEELTQMIQASTQGLLSSPLLVAQDIVWMILNTFPERLGFLYSLLYKQDNHDSMNTTSPYQKNIDLLKANKNLILTGAPGTGKTHMAKEIASAMEAEVGFVQFHPSYDYTDFVEGLRPVTDGNGNVGFERKDGVFKEFCKRALISKSVNKETMSELNDAPIVWKVSLAGTGDNPIRTDCLKQGYIRIGWPTYGDVEDFNEYSEFNDGGRNVLRAFQSQMREGDIVVSCYSAWEIDAVGIVTGEYEYKGTGGDYPRYRTVKWLVKNIKEDIVAMNGGKRFTLPSVYKSSITAEDALNIVRKHNPTVFVTDNEEQKFVFIIDEINRGEISKIFGELFFSIDPGYRGEKGKVNTQYQNMIEEGDVFKKGFYVPDNVFIIGTMNDIDRSVESMDFAMRRRFAWVEVTAEESYQNMIAESEDFTTEEKTEIRQRMFNLNAEIVKPELCLGEAYQIGAAYFRKYLDYQEEEHPFDCLWNNHLKGLLFEYLRGNQNATGQLEELKKAYDNVTAKHEATNSDNG